MNEKEITLKFKIPTGKLALVLPLLAKLGETLSDATPVAAVPTQTPQAVPTQEPQAVPTQEPQAQPVQTQAVPTQAVSPQAVPTTQTSYTLDDLARAAISLMDSGRQADLQGLLKTFGVDALPTLPQEKYGAFATALREMGAQI